LGFRVKGLGFRVEQTGFIIWGLEFRDSHPVVKTCANGSGRKF